MDLINLLPGVVSTTTRSIEISLYLALGVEPTEQEDPNGISLIPRMARMPWVFCPAYDPRLTSPTSPTRAVTTSTVMISNPKAELATSSKLAVGTKRLVPVFVYNIDVCVLFDTYS